MGIPITALALGSLAKEHLTKDLPPLPIGYWFIVDVDALKAKNHSDASFVSCFLYSQAHRDELLRRPLRPRIATLWECCHKWLRMIPIATKANKVPKHITLIFHSHSLILASCFLIASRMPSLSWLAGWFMALVVRICLGIQWHPCASNHSRHLQSMFLLAGL